MLGHLKKMRASLDTQTNQVTYLLPVGDEELPLNDFIGKSLTLTHTGNINCSSCGKKTKKSFSQGHCFPCMRKLASCDMCIMKPETCHHAEGTCREPQWGEENCMIPHYVYLANTSGLKVGITRHTQIPTRWIDQGATQAIPLFKVKTRLQSGLVEIALAEFIADKTNWRAMLKGENPELDLKQKALELVPQISERLDEIRLKFGEDSVELLDQELVTIDYPVTQYPTKIASHNFDKNVEVNGVLLGIKGQYLIFDTGVINVRKFTSYEIEVSY
ncbi:DUF2797 domain-containing protein [Psychrosphaera sp. B3R10]|uniref:DUF2797 domain-containing protein n=1 Tax=unclassified Psychrosphaera TaxID=2641570 RepID=UPI001C084947|nr:MULTISPECIES: DUF2797 domain-containing protein [unclassified Psychrosphaera]MBU2882602.1 DUF2797 domain-containing protein [Psychrosphaera sp. I2R16]MBU2989379.1 DUF2797 domain-containing protein [Psychrosphaera sp. B3R10]MDO6718213.1 DUF2797 domain-containing protein [Psychrosphaera sp. 1_MG-2023]